MNKPTFRPCLFWQRYVAAAVLSCLAFLSASAQAQQVSTLIEFTNVWKYDQSGLELGTAWRTNEYDDSTWPLGRGLLGFEDVTAPYNLHAPVLTQLTVSPAVTTFYFRTTFQFNGSMEGLSLIASNLVDDGCVIYLNGMQAGGVRAIANFNAATTFSGPATEGQLDVVTFANVNALRQGENLLAVEVHQSANTSADVMFGMKLVAVNETPLVITNPPQSQTVTLGGPVTFTVGVEGGPVWYRWQKGGVFLGSTSNSLVISAASPANAGNYQVVCTNTLTVVTSSVVTLTVVTDLSGPTVLAAIADNGFGPRGINIKFSESLATASARNTNNYTVTRLGTSSTVHLTNVLYATALGALLRLDANDPDWIPFADYVVTINNVTDIKGNAIAPNTTVPVSWLHPVSLVSAATAWSSHASYFLDQDIYNQPWNTLGYVENPQFWKTGVGPFCGGAITSPPCSMDCETPIDYQLSPTLFRTTFTRPAELGAASPLLLSGSVDDGAVVFLNGVEIWRVNALGTSPNITVTNYANLSRVGAYCFTNIEISVTNFLPGTNCLAVAVLQARQASEFDTVFFLTADAIATIAPVILPDPSPVLTIAPLPANAAQLSWIGRGYLLEASTNLSLGDMSYPYGPWTQVPQMSNPYLWSLTNSPARFFRLKK